MSARMTDEEFSDLLARHDGTQGCSELGAEARRARESEAALLEALGPDLAGREFADLLDLVANDLMARGGGPIEDCLRAKAAQARAAIAKAEGK